MIKLTFCLRRKQGLSLEQFQDYWLNTHAPIVRKQMDALHIRGYVQVHQLAASGLNDLLRASRNAPPAYDGIAELWYDSVEDLESTMQTDEALEAVRILLEDEKNFIDLENSPLWLNEEHEIISRGD